jgi:hypothetical protein
MPEATLESLRILSNLETEKSKLLQIILIGQPELEAVLAKHSMRQLAQRIAVRARVKSLTFRQSCRYIMHRTRCAGRLASRPLFTTPALLYVAFVAGGSPRTINICCDNALMNGYGHGAERITFGIVREACQSMKFRRLRRVAALAASLMVLVGLFATGNTLLRHFYTARAEPVPAGTEAPPPSSGPAPTAGQGLDGPGLAKPSAELPAAAQPLPSAAQDRLPGDSDGRGASPAAPDPAGSAAAEGAAAGAAGEAGSAAKGATPAMGAVATTGRAPAAGGQDGTQTPSSTDGPSGPAASTEPPAALRPAPANSVPAAPLPWVASDDASADQTHAASKAAGQTRATPNGMSRWVVREGDTVYKVCVVTYGSCDERTLRALLAENPKLGRDATIHPGDVLVLRKRARSLN